jgi:excisionase family DNA binding protein
MLPGREAVNNKLYKFRGGIMSRELLSIEQAAAQLGLKPVTVRQWANARKIARVKLGRRVLVPAAEVQRLIDSNLIPALPKRAAP